MGHLTKTGWAIWRKACFLSNVSLFIRTLCSSWWEQARILRKVLVKTWLWWNEIFAPTPVSLDPHLSDSMFVSLSQINHISFIRLLIYTVLRFALDENTSVPWTLLSHASEVVDGHSTKQSLPLSAAILKFDLQGWGLTLVTCKLIFHASHLTLRIYDFGHHVGGNWQYLAFEPSLTSCTFYIQVSKLRVDTCKLILRTSNHNLYYHREGNMADLAGKPLLTRCGLRFLGVNSVLAAFPRSQYLPDLEGLPCLTSYETVDQFWIGSMLFPKD